MKHRDKRRFDLILHRRNHRRKWTKEYWSKYHETMHVYENGYHRILTAEEHHTLWYHRHRKTIQEINKICGKPDRRIV